MQIVSRPLVALILFLSTAACALAACDPTTDPDKTDIASARAAVDINCDCAGTKHADYVRCAVGQADATLQNQGCRRDVKKAAASSVCGKPGFVTCCLTPSAGDTKCRVKKDANHCLPPKDGAACVGNYTSCADACTLTGCATTTSSSTSSSTSSTASTSTTTSTSSSTTTSTVPSCFVDQGLTVLDTCTGLLWEKKTGVPDDGPDVSCESSADPHNVHIAGELGVPQGVGPMYTCFLEKLNNRCSADVNVDCTSLGDAACAAGTGGPGGPCGFEGFRDWRVPGLGEYQSILDCTWHTARCYACLDPIFGPSNGSGTYSSSVECAQTHLATNGWIRFVDGRVGGLTEHSAAAIRAVRSPTSTTTTTTTTSTTATTVVSGCFTDAGDGTISDACTGLQWEKKTVTPGLHDVTNRYTWAGDCNGEGRPCQPNAAAAAACAAQGEGGTLGCRECTSGSCNVDPHGHGATTTVWDWLNQVNDASFAGHSDWRLPSEAGRNSPYTGAKEGESILLAPYPCGTAPCIDSIFGPTDAPTPYWSGTSDYFSPDAAWGVYFFTGALYNNGMTNGYTVRAVR